jgi:hypothetical protein
MGQLLPWATMTQSFREPTKQPCGRALSIVLIDDEKAGVFIHWLQSPLFIVDHQGTFKFHLSSLAPSAIDHTAPPTIAILRTLASRQFLPLLICPPNCVTVFSLCWVLRSEPEKRSEVRCYLSPQLILEKRKYGGFCLPPFQPSSLL